MPLIRLARRDGMVLAAIWLAVTAYNLFKPYHIDDTAHLVIAHWIAAHPLHPMSGMLYFGSLEEPIHNLNQPPLYFYLLAVWGSMFGYTETTMHALQALFALAAIVLFYRIARRLVPANAVWLTAMLALGPAFVVEQNLMVDVPLLALWLLFFDALLVRTDGPPQTRRFLIAALACSAAILVKYSSLVLVPILFATIVYERRWRAIWISLVPVAVIAVWSLWNYAEYRGVHILQRPAHAFRNEFWFPLLRFVALMAALGAVTPFGLIAVVRRFDPSRRFGRVIYLVVALFFAALTAGVAAGWLDEWPAEEVLRVAFLLSAAAMVLTVAIVLIPRLMKLWPPKSVDSRYLVLFLWIAGHIAFYSLFAPFMAVRHGLLVLPALLLAGTLAWPERLPRADAIFGLTVSIVLSVMLGWADWRFAAFYRDEAASIPASLPANARIWYVGGWGWQYYAAHAGLLPLNVQHPGLVPGDFLALPRSVDHMPLSEMPPLVLYRADVSRPGIGDLFCTADPSRFYGTPFSDFTRGPWHLTMSCGNAVDIYRAGPAG